MVEENRQMYVATRIEQVASKIVSHFFHYKKSVMKKLVLSLIAFLFFVAFGFAQTAVHDNVSVHEKAKLQAGKQVNTLVAPVAKPIGANGQEVVQQNVNGNNSMPAGPAVSIAAPAKAPVQAAPANPAKQNGQKSANPK
jgi:hypothetical protein